MYVQIKVSMTCWFYHQSSLNASKSLIHVLLQNTTGRDEYSTTLCSLSRQINLLQDSMNPLIYLKAWRMSTCRASVSKNFQTTFRRPKRAKRNRHRTMWIKTKTRRELVGILLVRVSLTHVTRHLMVAVTLEDPPIPVMLIGTNKDGQEDAPGTIQEETIPLQPRDGMVTGETIKNSLVLHMEAVEPIATLMAAVEAQVNILEHTFFSLQHSWVSLPLLMQHS